MNCSPLVETMDTRLLSSEELSLFIAAEAVAARPIFELAMASSNDGLWQLLQCDQNHEKR